MKYIPTFFIFALLIVPFPSDASVIIRSGEDISVGADQILEGDFYAAGESIQISGVAEHDVVIGASNVTINGEIRGDVAAAGMTVNIHGDVQDDVRIAGGEVVIASNISGDVVVVAASLTILSTATIEGDLVFWGGDLTLEGSVGGSVHGSADTVRIDSVIGGDIEYTTHKKFVLGDKTQVSGDVVYSGVEMVRAPNAVVVGDIQHSTSMIDNGSSQVSAFGFTFLVLLFSALSVSFIVRERILSLVHIAEQRVGFYGLVGLVSFFAIPFVSLLLFVSMVGSAVGLFVFFGYLALLMISFIITIIVFGHLFQKYVLRMETHYLFTPLIGAILFALIGQIPVIGGLTIFATTLVMLGAITFMVYQKTRS